MATETTITDPAKLLPSTEDVIKTTAVSAVRKLVKTGRPTRYDPSWMPERAVELLAEGHDMSVVAANFGVAVETLWRWAQGEVKGVGEEFRNALHIGQAASQAWWTGQSRQAVLDRGPFNTALWSINMHNRFGWVGRVDRVGHDHQHQHTLLSKGNNDQRSTGAIMSMARDEAR